MKVQIHQNDKHPAGFVAAFPYRASDVEKIRQCLGFEWDKNAKVWRSIGPEVLLDMQRFGIGIEWISPPARVVAEEFRQNLWKLADIRAQPFDPGQFGFQRQGSEFLANQEAAILADDMGTGKTKQSLDALAMTDFERCLVLTNKTPTYNWLKESQLWHPEINAGVVPEVSGRPRNQFWANPPSLVITNYEKVLSKTWPMDIEWDVVILDEASRLKNTATQTRKVVKKISQFAQHVWALTGSPLEIRLEELYNILLLLRPAVFGGNWYRFADQHVETDWAGDVTGTRNIDLLRDRLGPWMLRRTKAEVLPYLPPKLAMNSYIKMSIAEQKSYQHLLMEFDKWLKERQIQGDNGALVRTVRARQFCCSPAVFKDPDCGRGSKYEALIELLISWIREEDRFQKAVIFCSFEEVLSLLQSWLSSDIRTRYRKEAFLSGGVSAKERTRRIEAFNAGELGNVFLSTDAGNQGINLTGADMIVHYDQIWNPQRMRQREDRLHRIGQKESVKVVNLLMLDSIDVGMYNSNREREELFDEVVEGSEEAYIRKMSGDRLRKIMRGQS